MARPGWLMITIQDEIHEVLKALWGGARYATKIRLPHAILMTAVFRRDQSIRDNLRGICKLVLEHAANLASFAAIYKSILAILKALSRRIPVLAASETRRRSIVLRALRYFGATLVNLAVHGSSDTTESHGSPPGFPERVHHALIAGSVGGYVVWGKYSSLNYQILLYLSSRVLLGVYKRGVGWNGQELISSYSPRVYKLVAAVIWGLVMLLFEETPEVLHPSLKQSMDEIYRL